MMTFKDYWEMLGKTYGAKSKFSLEIGIPLARLSGIAAGRVRVGHKTAIKLEKETRGFCKRQEISPHLEW